MNELKHLVKEFFSKKNKAKVFYDLSRKKFNKILKGLKNYESPDIISTYDNVIVGIEHFEFDSYNKSNKKGSDYKIKENKLDKKFDNDMKEILQENDSMIVHDILKSTASLKNYFKNFEENFKKHYKKIPSYIKHINQDFNCQEKEIHIVFFAEDVTLLGNFFLDKNNDNNLTLLLPIYSEQIKQLLEKSPLVEYLIIGTACMSDNKLFIIKNSKEIFKKFKKENEEVEDKDFLKFDPQITSYGFKILKSEIFKKK